MEREGGDDAKEPKPVRAPRRKKATKTQQKTLSLQQQQQKAITTDEEMPKEGSGTIPDHRKLEKRIRGQVEWVDFRHSESP